MKKIKICGLNRLNDIDFVNHAKPDYCGFVINFPKSIRSISPEKAEELCTKLSNEVCPVGVFVDSPVKLVAELLNKNIIKIAQLHGNEDESYIRELRTYTSKPIWKAFQVRVKDDVVNAENSSADFVLLDSGQGKGKTFNWNLICNFPKPFGLAGGLTVKNIPDAMETYAALLDVSSGVETDGVKDYEKIIDFVNKVRYTA